MPKPIRYFNEPEATVAGRLRGVFGGRRGVAGLLVAPAMKLLAGTMGRERAVRDASGVAAVEFALLLPVLMLALTGMFVFGIALNNYVSLTNAAQAGALQLAVSRGDSKPYSDTVSAIQNVAPGLTPASLTITLTVNGTACASDATCNTALTSAAGKSAAVQASYPCSLVVMAVTYACTMTVNTTERIQ
jgi:Flp pilus assembly protein TadG